MNRLNRAKRIAVVAALVEGNSLRSTCRMTDVSMPTVLKLLSEFGPVCASFHDKVVRDVQARRVQVDEIWQCVYAKNKNVPEKKRGQFGYGDTWTWVGIDADSKPIISWRIDPRDLATGYEIMHDLADRKAHCVQLTTDGLKAYLEATESAFNLDIDYAQLHKIYGSATEGQTR
jgi:IS1 family transposase